MRYMTPGLGALLVACSTAPNEGLDARVALDRTRLVRGETVTIADLVTRSLDGRPYVRQFSWAGYTGIGASGTSLPAGTYLIVGGAGAPGSVQGSTGAPVSLELVEQL